MIKNRAKISSEMKLLKQTKTNEKNINKDLQLGKLITLKKEYILK